MDLELKVYDIDYSTVIRNYLNPALWEKIYNVFQYREHVFNMHMDNIYCQDKKICLKYYIKHDGYTYNNYIYIYLNNLNMKVVQKQVNGVLFSLVENVEDTEIRRLPEYKRIEDGYDKEKEILRTIANEFLDSNGITNDEIRDVYIDNYVDKHTKTYSILSNFRDDKKYTVMTDLYLTLTKAMGDTSRYDTIINKVGRDTTIIDFNEIMESIESGEYEEEMRGELDEI